MKQSMVVGLQRTLELFSKVAAEGRMLLDPNQFCARLAYMPNHEIWHIRIEYVCGLNATCCANMTDRLVEEIIKEGLDHLPIICSFVPFEEEQPAHKFTSLATFMKNTGVSEQTAIKLIKPEHIYLDLQ